MDKYSIPVRVYQIKNLLTGGGAAIYITPDGTNVGGDSISPQNQGMIQIWGGYGIRPYVTYFLFPLPHLIKDNNALLALEQAERVEAGPVAHAVHHAFVLDVVDGVPRPAFRLAGV